MGPAGDGYYLTWRGQVAAAWNDDKESLVVLNSFIQAVEIGETNIIRIFKSKIKTWHYQG